ncbi:FAD-binding and (Fe-S)-binding domain-containing protein [Streptomyces candidus]|uniref:FAD/FMN-containing dehydrogenase/Fe-S oxidoreductase n=1 Tax=Streptomyces candidus TaxID=67283 RepID=A0A7X0HDH4_9ACTN|nr:FAD-binding and (Fe-S)-binding domain-containing protein [Streptomyces candidus]MBB6435579.1 FAD/FMN-containing dehydrogenase/Fe-S oxidoreductase [Streptomyces candidus]
MAEQRRETTELASGPTSALAADLRAAVRGEVSFDAAARALMTMDASNYRRVPLGVVAPRDPDDVAAALAVCRAHGVPVVPRGGGTSLAGQATGTGVVLDTTRHLRRILDLDPGSRTALVRPGVVLDDLRAAAAPYGLTFGPDPSTHSRCTLGGMIGNNSCGSHSVAWGTTADQVRTLNVLTYGGEELHLSRGGWDSVPETLRPGLRPLVEQNLALLRTGFPALPRRISGYALDALLPENGVDLARAFCGSEGTLGVVTEAVVSLVEAPRARALAVLGHPDESAAAEAACGVLAYGPLTVEGMAADLVPERQRALLPRGAAWLFVETGGDSAAEARARAQDIVRGCSDAVDGVVIADAAAQRALWRVREDASGTATRLPDGSEAWPGWEDCAVPPARLGAYLRDFRALLSAHGLRGTPYGHFGDGCIHVRIDFDLLSAPGIAAFRRFSEELADLVTAHGGSLSGEHGDGQARAELLPRMYGPELVSLFSRFKDVWDPAGGMNPGVLARPARLDENLRFAVLPAEPVRGLAFSYPHDGGDFSAAVRRCVGVAKCRTESVAGSAGVMCPSYRATGEEAHSTRGRARLLHEMLAGEVVQGGWRSPEVAEALDLCLSCKGCRTDCPVGVDMATYKAEFLHQHYRGRLRPPSHYALGRLAEWLRLAAPFARQANAAARVDALSALAKKLTGIAPERRIPQLAPRTFRHWARTRPPVPVAAGAPTVLLWPDTFTNHLSPSVGIAAVRVLEAAGLRVRLPRAGLCCGLTYVSTGQLDRAREVMRRTVRAIGGELPGATAEPAGQGLPAASVRAAGGEPRTGDLPLVVLEPSCAAALRTDLPELLPDDPAAARLAARVRTFAQTLEEYAPHWTPPRLDRPVAGQTHCHQHAVLGDDAERRLRDRAGLTGTLVGGCCGMAGNFGFEKGHYEVSTACAEDQLLPAVRALVPGGELLADGYSCRTQLEQLTEGPRARHLAEVLADAL